MNFENKTLFVSFCQRCDEVLVNIDICWVQHRQNEKRWTWITIKTLEILNIHTKMHLFFIVGPFGNFFSFFIAFFQLFFSTFYCFSQYFMDFFSSLILWIKIELLMLWIQIKWTLLIFEIKVEFKIKILVHKNMTKTNKIKIHLKSYNPRNLACDFAFKSVSNVAFGF